MMTSRAGASRTSCAEPSACLAATRSTPRCSRCARRWRPSRTPGSWSWPGKKDKGERTADERWALIRAAMEDQASGAIHVDPGTRDCKYTRAEVETLIAMTAAVLCIVPDNPRSRTRPRQQDGAPSADHG